MGDMVEFRFRGAEAGAAEVHDRSEVHWIREDTCMRCRHTPPPACDHPGAVQFREKLTVTRVNANFSRN
ncbi:hypothetical protein [Saccharopolyspora pogona]|uniref:hypothetical protein n=1 Tax=Saccharopolyspora pogona TaxID=333966 RepID=UPI001685C1A3|nr:hypothetical protein [Saccharopolyspora pogona]